MDYNAIWNDICFHVEKNRDSVEQDFQKTIELLFERLGWSALKEEIVTQIEVPVGSSSSYRPDIVIKNADEMMYVVELKRVNVNLSERNAEQLFSYMRLLKLNFGVLLGESLRLYYESPSTHSPVKVCDINFILDSEAGIECIEVLSKEGFSIDRLNEFCINSMGNPEKYCEKRVRSGNSTYSDGSRESAFASKSSVYGKEKRGQEIFNILSQHGVEGFWVGKRDIASKINNMSKSDLLNTKFWLNDKASQIPSSWITGQKFKLLFEGKS